LHSLFRHDKPPKNNTISKWREIPVIPGVDLTRRAEKKWGWIIFPPKFRSENILNLTLLQSWTWKPALLK